MMIKQFLTLMLLSALSLSMLAASASASSQTDNNNAERVDVDYVRGATLADRRKIPEGYWLSEMISSSP